MKKIEPCSNCGDEASFYQGWPGRQWLVFCTAQGCKNETKFYRSKKKSRKAWNNQQRQAKPREWKDEITKAFRVLRRTIGSQEWLDYLMPDDIINIRDNFIPVFKKHLEMRKLVAQPKPEIKHDVVVKMQSRETISCKLVPDAEYEKLITRLLKLETENKKLKIDNQQQVVTTGQLRLRIQQLEAAPAKPLVDFDKVLLENEQLREQSRQLARTLTKLAVALGKVE